MWTLALLVLVPGCHSIEPYLAQLANVSVERYVVVAPRERSRLDCVQRFIARKKAAGYDVRIVTFATAGDAPTRLAEVRAKVSLHEPAPKTLGYVLFLATVDELPMGPWVVEGSDGMIDSDLPLLAGHTDPATPLTEADWWRAVGSEPRWVHGRVPFDDEAVIEKALAGPDVSGQRTAPPLALLGAERHAVWWDASLVMSRARRRIEAGRWRTITYAEDWPCDIELDVIDAASLQQTYRDVGLDFDDSRLAAHGTWLTSRYSDLPPGVRYVDPEQMPTNTDLVFTSHWCELSPDVVYVNSHGSGWRVGKYLLSASGIERCATTPHPGKSQPEHAALVVLVACRAGEPDSDLTRCLFQYGFASAVVAATEVVKPTPLHVAIRAEIDVGTALVSGLSVGLGVRAVRCSYLDHARSTWSYACFDSTAPTVAQNLLSLTVCGDPSMPMRTLSP